MRLPVFNLGEFENSAGASREKYCTDMDTPSFWHFAPLVQKMVDSHCSMENN